LLILLDHSEQISTKSRPRFPLVPQHPFLAVLGDAGDRQLLSSLFEENQAVDCLSRAAFSMFHSWKRNPFAAIRNTRLVTWDLARLAAEHDVAQFCSFPRTKRESAQHHGRIKTPGRACHPSRRDPPASNRRAIRLGNVLGFPWQASSRSFYDKLRASKISPSRHKDVTRYFLTWTKTVNLIFRVASLARLTASFFHKWASP